MRILISGAAGFLGRRFAEHYDTEDNRLTLIDNLQSPYARAYGTTWGQFFIQDIREFIRYGYAKGKVYDLFFHFAAPVGGREKIEGDPLFNAESLEIDSAVFRWAVSRVNLMVYPSSSAVYPTWMQNAPIYDPLEERDFTVDNLDSWGVPDEMYGFTKLAGEVLAAKAAPYGLNTLVLRPFSGYGEGQSYEYPFPSIIRRVVSGDDPVVVWGSGEQSRDFIHVEDIIRITGRIIDKGISGYNPVNLATGIGTTFNELLALALEQEIGPVIRDDYPEYPEIQHLLDKPVGVRYRVGDPTKMMEMSGTMAKIGLAEGVRRMLAHERKKLHA